ncbi:MAG: DNA glycosylase [Eubacteriales bacterium]|nr:DNA glycosylase [Eubacteriales bacterium]
MVIKTQDDFNLKMIADSGQCFRWKQVGKNTYKIPAFGRVLCISGQEGNYELDCTEQEYETCWKRYFDMENDYASIRGRIPETDAYLYHASQYGLGIRILQQEPWETLATFLLSQRKNIPAIKQAVEMLCIQAGTRIENQDEEIYAFPTPEQIAGMSGEQMDACRLGYRAKYVRRLGEIFALGELTVEGLSALTDKELLETLLGLYGVGVKVASCTALFGFHRLDLFPRDVWINRVLEERYPQGFPYEEYAPYNGIMQQYLFYFRRLGERS